MRPRPTPKPSVATGPITSPSQVDAGSARSPGRVATGPITSPSQVDAGPARSPARVGSGPITSPSQADTGPARAPARVGSGPITSPSQVDAGPARSPASEPIDPYANRATSPGAGLSRRFDPLFEKYRGAIPIEYLRALVARESGTNPNARSHAARGLMQILPVVLTDYNTRHGTRYQLDHLFDPAINIAIGCELLRLIIASYHRHHPRVPNLRTDWQNLRFVELLTFGWNTGFSEVGGVGLVARYLEQRGITEQTIELVHQSAGAAGASKYLADATSVRWGKSVAALYARELASSRPSTP